MDEIMTPGEKHTPDVMLTLSNAIHKIERAVYFLMYVFNGRETTTSTYSLKANYSYLVIIR